MAVTVSLVVLFGALLFVMLRARSVGCGAAFVAMMFGFFLASTGAAEPIRSMTAALASVIPSL
ncbi:hypothetical protein [Streptomyces sp. NPDC003023]|uniref:hypothetical protein n=1 Tax=Streptomyces sp. NPDC003023 TaxID=3364675 RepID=UPI0036A0342B